MVIVNKEVDAREEIKKRIEQGLTYLRKGSQEYGISFGYLEDAFKAIKSEKITPLPERNRMYEPVSLQLGAEEKIHFLEILQRGIQILTKYAFEKGDRYITRRSQETDENIGREIDKQKQFLETLPITKEKRPRELEYIVNISASIFAISSFILALFFLSSNFTGYAIADMANSTYNPLGVLFFIVGLVFAFAYLKKKK